MTFLEGFAPAILEKYEKKKHVPNHCRNAFFFFFEGPGPEPPPPFKEEQVSKGYEEQHQATCGETLLGKVFPPTPQRPPPNQDIHGLSKA